MKNKIKKFIDRKISNEKMAEIFQGWNAYAKWADSFNLRKDIMKKIYKIRNSEYHSSP